MSSLQENNKRKADEKELPVNDPSETSKKLKTEEKKQEKKTPTADEKKEEKFKIFDPEEWVKENVSFMPSDKLAARVERVFSIVKRRWREEFDKLFLSTTPLPTTWLKLRDERMWDNEMSIAEFRKSPKMAQILEFSPIHHFDYENMVIDRTFDGVPLPVLMFSLVSWNRILSRKLDEEFCPSSQPPTVSDANEAREIHKQHKALEQACKDCEERHQRIVSFTKLLDMCSTNSYDAIQYGGHTSIDVAHP